MTATYLHDKILREAREQRESDPRIRRHKNHMRPSDAPLPALASRVPDPVSPITGAKAAKVAVAAQLGNLSLKSPAQIACVVRSYWPTPYFGAVPYINALRECDDWSGDYGADSVESLTRYFLSNAQTWRGPVARAVKAELRRRYP